MTDLDEGRCTRSERLQRVVATERGRLFEELALPEAFVCKDLVQRDGLLATVRPARLGVRARIYLDQDIATSEEPADVERTRRSVDHELGHLSADQAPWAAFDPPHGPRWRGEMMRLHARGEDWAIQEIADYSDSEAFAREAQPDSAGQPAVQTGAVPVHEPNDSRLLPQQSAFTLLPKSEAASGASRNRPR